MKTIFLDFETYYSTREDYTLRKVTPVEYILDPRFETIGCAVVMNGLSTFMTHDQLKVLLAQLPGQVAVVSHNALFDMCVLAYRYDYVPTLMIDTMGMSKAWWGHEVRSHALAYIAEAKGIGAKGTEVYQMDGKRMRDIVEQGLWPSYSRYSVNDAELCAKIYYKIMGEGFPVEELLVQDMVLRCAVQPKFALDRDILHMHLNEVQQQKEALLASVGIERSELMSNDKFAVLLQGLGIDPPRKTSLTTGMETWAFSKTDPYFMALEDHEDPDVQALIAARIGTKSTLEESRTKRFISISNLTWAGNEQCLMPVPLSYGAAHTHRLGGAWKLNLQNMPRGSKSKPPRLRKSLRARKGKIVVKADASQIEARFVMSFCGQKEGILRFERGEDSYSALASEIFGFPVDKSYVPERFVGKTAFLGCGFGVAGEKFARTIRLQSKALLGTAIDMSDAEGARVVGVYRNQNNMVPMMWKRLNNAIPAMMRKDCELKIGPITIEHERVRLPNGLFLNYKGLHRRDIKPGESEWAFTYAGIPNKLYGGKFLENIIQALARIATMEAAVRIRHRLTTLAHEYGIDPGLFDLGLQEHDALVYCPPIGFEDAVGEILIEEMERRPTWHPEVPLACQDGYAVGSNYGDAK